MAGFVTGVGERVLLSAALDAVGPLSLRLAKTAFAPTASLTLAGITEADYVGYEPLPLTLGTVQPGTPGGRAEADFANVTFTCGGSATPNSIYGYFVTDGSGNLLWCELFGGAPRPMDGAGRTVSLDISLRLWAPN